MREPVDRSNATFRERRAGAIALLILLGLWVLPVTIALVAFAVGGHEEERVLSLTSESYVVAGARTDSGSQEAVVDVELASPRSVTSTLAGTVTAIYVEGSSALSNGTPVVRVDDQTLVAFVQPVPLYRDLSRGDRGEDVSSLEAFLAGMGFLDEGLADDYLGTATVEAFSSFQTKNGFPVESTFRATSVLFVGENSTVGEVAVSVGERVDVLTELLVTTPGTMSVTLRDRDLQMLTTEEESGLRIKIGDQTFNVASPTTTGIEAQELAQWLDATATSSEVVENGGIKRYPEIRVEFATPTRWASVPATAIYVSQTGTACLIAESGRALPVNDYIEAPGELGVYLVDDDYIGERIYAHSTQTSAEDRAECN